MKFLATFIAFAAVFFAGASATYVFSSDSARKTSRVESCDAFHDLFASNRNSTAREDAQFQSGAYDDLIPEFANPKIKRLSHRNAVRRFKQFDNENLPKYCKERSWPEKIPAKFSLHSINGRKARPSHTK